MKNVIVLGAQWGDEGKGKIVDLLCPAFDNVVRFQGGHNAGHTVRFADRHFSLHLVPSGILHSGVDCFLGPGMVIAPDALNTELASLAEAGVDTTGRLFISDRAQVILPTHASLDQAREEASSGRIGTTARGIGPAYEMRAARCGVRMGELDAELLEQRLRVQHMRIMPELDHLGVDGMPRPSELMALCRTWADELGGRVIDVSARLAEKMAAGERILFEGAQGALLDVDHGTYPFVTSSTPTAGGVAAGAGVAPTRLDATIGVLKAYTTRVGGGPFPTELEGDVAEFLRDRGNEFGTTTGRPRRCGWLDIVAARYAHRLNAFDALALTKLDVLDDLDEIQLCTGYRYQGEVIEDFPSSLAVLEAAEPIYRRVEGWRAATTGVTRIDDLPLAARRFVEVVEELVGAPAMMVSTGARREETILVDPLAERLLGDRLSSVLEHRDGKAGV
ncbi:MAG: adenylosuccinate synthase [Acidobacteriota bacterium]